MEKPVKKLLLVQEYGWGGMHVHTRCVNQQDPSRKKTGCAHGIFQGGFDKGALCTGIDREQENRKDKHEKRAVTIPCTRGMRRASRNPEEQALRRGLPGGKL